MSLEVPPERRTGNLSYEPGAGLLVVGARTAVLEAHPATDAVVGTYVELVVAQRDIAPHTHDDLRSRELVQLSALLELPQVDLDALIDRELARLLGAPTPVEAAFTPTVPDRPSSPGRRRVLLVAGMGVAGLAVVAVAVTVASIAETAAVRPPHVVSDGSTVEVIELEGGGTATRTESAPVPVAADGTDIGSSVLIERNP